MDTIIFSGGYDSTALLLSKFGEDDKQYKVLSFYCDTTTNCDEDRNGRERVKKILSNHKNYKNFTFEEVELKNCHGGTQGTVWPGLSLSGIECDTQNESKIYFGYIRGDDFWHYRSHIEDIYESFSKILYTKITPVFPFEWKYKKDLVYLYSTIPDVFDAISWAGDTSSVKLKEKEELQTILEQIKLSISFNCPDTETKKQTIDEETQKTIDYVAKKFVDSLEKPIGQQLDFDFYVG